MAVPIDVANVYQGFMRDELEDRHVLAANLYIINAFTTNLQDQEKLQSCVF